MINIEGKNISVIGAVRSGVGAAKLAKKLGAVPFVSDSGSKEKLIKTVELLEAEGINYECDAHTEKVFDCELLVTSPGVPSDSQILTEAREKGIKIISEVEFASWFCKGGIIAITGTNGKTTTTSLMDYTLNECGIKCYSAGNIGTAFSEIVLDVKENEYVALEVSSFQLDFIDTFKPKFSMILNITPDHLDRYSNSFRLYEESKIKIVVNQNENDLFIYNYDDANTYKLVGNNKVKRFGFSVKTEINNGAYLKEDKMIFSKEGAAEEICSISDLFIKGEHNAANALAVVAVAKNLELPNKKIKEAFKNFKGVEHRIEFVREINGVEYYNDSKATNVDSVWFALRSFQKPIYLILGGKDKGNDYNQIKELVQKNVKKIYAIGSSANKVYDFFKDVVSTEYKQTLENCVESARKEAKPGSVVLLSPACASFDMFDNYEHRGKVFKEAINKL